MNIVKTILLFSFCINILYSGTYQQFVIPCKIPHSPNTPSAPKASKNGVYAGNCRVQGDNGIATCHTPNEQAKDQSYMKKRNQFDSYFMASQKITGVSWKILKAKAYQESSLNYGKPGIMIKTGDGVAGGGILQLSKGEVNAVLRKIRANTPWGGTITGITQETTFTNPIHHCLVGTGWIFHKIPDSSQSKILANQAHTMRNSPDGWVWKTNNDKELLLKLKTFTYFNGWSKGCVVKGRPLFRYGEIINSNLGYLITGVSSTPLPYSGGGEGNTTLPTLPNTGKDPISSKPLVNPNKQGNPFSPWKAF